MLYAFIFQDALYFGFINEDAMINLAEDIENHKWVVFQPWMDAHHDLLIQHHEVKALDSSVRRAPSLM